MEEVKVVYWSGTGNTEAMAAYVEKGAKDAGVNATSISVDAASVDELAKEKGFALGCPSMGVEELEETTMEPFVAELEGKVAGKQIVLFGSYGWGDGEWMRNWVERMESAGATVVGGEGIIVNGEPDDATIEQLMAAGKELAQL
ncbi:MAG: flavodoxin [Lachnospiraceae bacterium]|nr:flavodoxin [Lachnospiraceae bacterium]